jgi:hypothetical protein
MKPENKKNKNSQQLDEVVVKLDGINVGDKIHESVDVKALKKAVTDKQKQVKDNQIIRK